MFSYLESFLEKGVVPPQKVLNFFCEIIGGQFVTAEQLEKYEEIRMLYEYEKDKNKQLAEGNKALNDENERLRNDLTKVKIKRENFARNYGTTENKYNNEKEDKTFKETSTVFSIDSHKIEGKKDVSNILEWED